MKIDAHTHVVPDRLPDPIDDDSRWPSMVVGGEVGEVHIAGKLFRKVAPEAWDPLRRLAHMDRDEVSVHVVSPMPELMSYWAGPESASRFCSSINAWVAEFVSAAPDRFVGLGIVPLQSPSRAIDQVGEIVRLGLSGVMVGSHVNGVSIAAEEHDAFLSTLAGAGLSIFVHAFQPCHRGAFSPRLANAITFPWEIGYAASSLIARGGALRTPGLRLAVSHGGGGALPGLGRLINAWDSFDEVRAEMGVHPLEAARSMFYDSIVFDPRVLRLHADTVGVDRIMLGTDFPFMRGSLDAIVEQAGFAHDEASQLAHITARAWLGGG